MSAHAAAQVPFQVPEGCGSPEELERELLRLLGPDASGARPSSLLIAFREGEGKYALRMTLDNEVRELQHADCRTLFRSAIVVAAASVRPELRSPPEEEAPRASSPSPPAGASEDGGREPLRGALALGVGAAGGFLPGLAPLLELTGFSEWGPVGASLSLRYLPKAAAREEGGRGVDVAAAGGRVAALFRPVRFGRLSVGVEVDRLDGRGFGVPEPLSAAVWTVAPSVEITGIIVDLNYLRFEVGAQGRFSLVRPRFEIGGFGEVYRVPAVGAGGVFRGAWIFL